TIVWYPGRSADWPLQSIKKPPVPGSNVNSQLTGGNSGKVTLTRPGSVLVNLTTAPQSEFERTMDEPPAALMIAVRPGHAPASMIESAPFDFTHCGGVSPGVVTQVPAFTIVDVPLDFTHCGGVSPGVVTVKSC